MPNPEAQRWDERYQRERELWLESEPRQLLTNYAHLLPTEGRALDAASGVAIHALFLAQRGLKAFALDISVYALRLAKERANNLGLPLEVAVIDLSNPWLPTDHFEVIVNFHFLERRTIPVYRQALTPGGVIFFDTFTKRDEKNDSPIYYLDPGELIEWFKDFEIIHYVEKDLNPSENHPERGLAQLVARKPKVK
jgi:2-polyprenyl-3-methyl-5-hydroxy-6-metoxy-1,4-benzoquinol methylase